MKTEVQLTKEGDMFVAYSPTLDLSTCGLTLEEAQANFEEAEGILLEELAKDHNKGGRNGKRIHGRGDSK